jgi:transcriptional regulator with XRE-family HTH domain
MPKRDSTLIKLGLNIRKRREALDFSQEKLAEKANLDQTYISGIECGWRVIRIWEHELTRKNEARLLKRIHRALF